MRSDHRLWSIVYGRFFCLTAFLIITTLPFAPGTAPRTISTQDLAQTKMGGNDWITHGGALNNDRYSSLNQINTSNVSQLKGVWMSRLGSGRGSKYKFEADPVVVNGIMYIPTGNDDIFAMDAKTGRKIWEWDSDIPQVNDLICCGWDNRGVAVGDEADVVAVRLVRDGEPAPRGFRPDLRLGRVAEREHGVGDLLGGEDGQHIGLVLAGIRGPLQDPVADPRVVTGADRIEAERQRAVEHRRELDLLVAAQARVGSAARGVLGDEILHHVTMESLGHVPDVERDPDDVGSPARIPGVLQRAAAAGTGPVRRRVGGQRQMDAGHLVTRVHRTSRSRGRVHSA